MKASFFGKHIKRYILLYVTVILLMLLVGSAYLRFFVLNDYIIAYEGDCDPYTESCYLFCEDESCTEPFYYSIIERNAAEVQALCNTSDVTTCDDAYFCPDDGTFCSVEYCDQTESSDECEYLTEDDFQMSY